MFLAGVHFIGNVLFVDATYESSVALLIHCIDLPS